MTLSLLAALALHVVPIKADFPPYIKKELYAKTDLRGKKAPKTVWGETVAGTIPSLKGKVVLIDFWATWCPPCRETLPELSGFQKTFAEDLVVIGVSDEPKAKLTEFLTKTPVAYAITSDPKGTMKKAIGVQGIPHVLVISPDGIVRWQGFPLDDADPLTEAKLAAIIAASRAK